MKKALKLSLVLLFAAMSGFAQENDKKFISADGGFRINLPSAYKSAEFAGISAPQVGVDGEGKAYSWEVYPIINAKVTYYLLTKKKGALTQDDKTRLLEYLKTELNKSLASMSAPVTEKEYSFQGSKGFELQITYPGGKGILRAFISGKRLFCLTLVFPTDLDEPQFTGILDSFHILTNDELVAAKTEQAAPETLPQAPRTAKARTDAEDAGLKGKVKSVLEDKEEPKVKREHFSEKYFDEAGYLVKELEFQEGYPEVVTVWGYIDNKRVSSESYIYFDEDQRPPLRVKVMTIMETPPDIPASISSAGPPDIGIAAPTAKPLYAWRFEYKYDEQKRLIEESTYEGDGTLFDRYVFKYLPGRIDKISYDFDGTETSYNVNILDKDGSIIEEYLLDKKLPADRRVHKYEFDAQGNWTVRKTYQKKTVKGKPVLNLLSTSYRAITYYP